MKIKEFYCEGIDKLNFAQKCHKQCDICFKLKTSAGGKRKGAGRPKKEENITFSVRGHESVKEATRQFAKTESEKITKNTKS